MTPVVRAVLTAALFLSALIACESDPRRRGSVDAAPTPRDAQPTDFGAAPSDLGPRDLGGPPDLGRDFGIDSGSGGGLCSESCSYSNDGDCDDGGPGSDFSLCSLGTDCIDCGPR